MTHRWDLGRCTLLAGLLLLAASCGRPAPVPTAPSEPAPQSEAATPLARNVLFITVDALRADRLGCYGYGRDTSPAIDALAREGMVFEHAIVQQGSTWPSLTSFQTSLYPATHGVQINGAMIAPQFTQLAEHLSAQGFACGACLANCIEQAWEGFGEIAKTQDDDMGVTVNAIDWLKRNHGQRFYLWLHYFATHAPYDPPEQYRKLYVDPNYSGLPDAGYSTLGNIMAQTKDISEADLAFINSMYDGEVRFADDEVKKVLDALESLGHANDTLVVFSADHGDTLYDRNKYFYHSCSIHEPVLRVPLIFRLPGAISPNQRVPSVVQSIDVAPTMLEMLGLPAPEAYQGVSLAPLFRGSPLTLGPAYTEICDKIIAIRTDAYRYIWNPSHYMPVFFSKKQRIEWHVEGPVRGFQIDEQELYATPKDPKELENLIAAEPEIAASLKEQLMQWKDVVGWTLNGSPAVKMRQDLEEKLNAMGYAVGADEDVKTSPEPGSAGVTPQ